MEGSSSRAPAQDALTLDSVASLQDAVPSPSAAVERSAASTSVTDIQAKTPSKPCPFVILDEPSILQIFDKVYETDLVTYQKLQRVCRAFKAAHLRLIRSFVYKRPEFALLSAPPPVHVPSTPDKVTKVPTREGSVPTIFRATASSSKTSKDLSIDSNVSEDFAGPPPSLSGAPPVEPATPTGDDEDATSVLSPVAGRPEGDLPDIEALDIHENERVSEESIDEDGTDVKATTRPVREVPRHPFFKKKSLSMPRAPLFADLTARDTLKSRRVQSLDPRYEVKYRGTAAAAVDAVRTGPAGPVSPIAEDRSAERDSVSRGSKSSSARSIGSPVCWNASVIPLGVVRRDTKSPFQRYDDVLSSSSGSDDGDGDDDDDDDDATKSNTEMNKRPSFEIHEDDASSGPVNLSGLRNSGDAASVSRPTAAVALSSTARRLSPEKDTGAGSGFVSRAGAQSESGWVSTSAAMEPLEPLPPTKLVGAPVPRSPNLTDVGNGAGERGLAQLPAEDQSVTVQAARSAQATGSSGAISSVGTPVTDGGRLSSPSAATAEGGGAETRERRSGSMTLLVSSPREKSGSPLLPLRGDTGELSATRQSKLQSPGLDVVSGLAPPPARGRTGTDSQNLSLSSDASMQSLSIDLCASDTSISIDENVSAHDAEQVRLQRDNNFSFAYSRRREVVSLHCGGGAARMGAGFWRALFGEHRISADGFLDLAPAHQDETRGTDMMESGSESFFAETKYGRRVPRAAVFATPDDMSSMRTKWLGGYSASFDPSFMTTVPDTAGVCAYDVAGSFRNEWEDVIRRMAETCDSLQGFHVHGALGGGSGSGALMVLFDILHDEYAQAHAHAFPVLGGTGSFGEGHGPVVEPYNAALAMQTIGESASLAVMLSNQSAASFARKRGGMQYPSLDEVNHVYSTVLSNVTAPLRSETSLLENMREFENNLVLPGDADDIRLKYISVNYGSYFHNTAVKRRSSLKGSLALALMATDSNQLHEMTLSALSDATCMSGCQPRSQGEFANICLLYRGEVNPEQVYENVKRRGYQKNLSFVDWCAPMFKCGCIGGAVPATGSSTPQSAMSTPRSPFRVEQKVVMVLSNTTAIADPIGQLSQRLELLFNKRAFCHWFERFGIDKADIGEAQIFLDDLEEAYRAGADGGSHSSGEEDEDGAESADAGAKEKEDSRRNSTSLSNFGGDEDILDGDQ